MVSKIISDSSSEEQAKDRLSNLPTDIIAHILSFLPTKIAATTSVLSERWKFLFHSISHIDLNGRWEFSYAFYKFVYKLLLSPHLSTIHSLRLVYLICHDEDPTHDWIVAAIQRRVEELALIVNTTWVRHLPVEIFNCKTIRVLRIHGNFYFAVPYSVHMPNLVELHLKHVMLLEETCFNRISSKLKHLSLVYCRMNSNNKVIQLVSQSLTNFILRSYMDTKFDNYEIALHAPNLVCLDVKSSNSASLMLMEKLSRLTSVDVNFGVPEIYEGYMAKGYMAKVDILFPSDEFVDKFMETIDNVKILRLSDYSLKTLCFSTCRLPTFHNLTFMELGVNYSVGWQLLAKLLESSPNLEVLNFEKGFVDQFSVGCIVGKLDFEYCLPKKVPICLLENLRKIKVGDFRGGKCEFGLIKYFLWSGKVLEEIKICSQSLFERSSSFYVKLLLKFFCWKLLGYPKCSKTCKIVMCWKADGNLYERIIN